MEDRGKRTQNTAERAQRVKPRGGEKTGCKPGYSKPDNTCQPKNAVDSKQSTHKGTDTHPETAQMLRTKSETPP